MLNREKVDFMNNTRVTKMCVHNLIQLLQYSTFGLDYLNDNCMS